MGLEDRVRLARLIVALADDDKDAVVKAYTGMGVRTERMGEQSGVGGGRGLPRGPGSGSYGTRARHVVKTSFWGSRGKGRVSRF